MVCKLNKSIYSLKQAARCWNLAIDKFLKSSGYTQSTADPCIYSKIELRDGRECLMIVAVYVDDTILASNDHEMLKSEKAKLTARFEMEDREPIHYCLGMSVKCDSQAKVLSISRKPTLRMSFNGLECMTAKLCSPRWNQGRSMISYQIIEILLTYKDIKLLWDHFHMPRLRDISLAVRVISQFMPRPGPEHSAGTKRVFRYTKDTLDFGLLSLLLQIKEISVSKDLHMLILPEMFPQGNLLVKISCCIFHRSCVCRSILCSSRDSLVKAFIIEYWF